MQEEKVTRNRLRTFALIISFCALALVILGASILDGTQGLVGPVFGPEDTTYARGYSLIGFLRVRPGMTENEVRNILGSPLLTTWSYEGAQGAEDIVRISPTSTIERLPARQEVSSLRLGSVKVGMTAQQALTILGKPTRTTWVYSKRDRDVSYRQRSIGFRGGRVTEVNARHYRD